MALSSLSEDILDRIMERDGRDSLERWAVDEFDLCTQAAKDEAVEEAKEEGHQDGLFVAQQEQEISNKAPIDPLEHQLSALASGQIGRAPWAIVERGDGLILAIGALNVPIDTPQEMLAAFMLGHRLSAEAQRVKARALEAVTK